MLKALNYASLGLPVFPCNADKSPKTPRGFKDASLEAKVIEKLWKDCPDALIGIATGGKHHLCCIDIDAKHSRGLSEEFAKRAQSTGIDTSRILIQGTPNGGGAHYIFFSPHPVKTQVLARNGKRQGIIETRADGAYIIAAPSRGYEVRQGSFDAIPVLSKEEVHELLELARSFGTPEELPPWKQPSLDAGDDSLPGNDFNMRGEADFFALLRSHGWHTHDKNAVIWRRPGKDGGQSATWNHVPGKFFVFTSSAPPFDPGRGYTPFAVFAMLEHDGDFKAAARALQERGYGSRERDSGTAEVADISRLIKALTEAVDEGDTFEDLFVDIGGILDSGYHRELPTIGRIQGGGCLLYPGRLNEIHAEPSVGKTNVALAIAAEVLTDGGVVVFVDPEDNPAAITARLAGMGAPEAAMRSRFRYLHDPDRVQVQRAQRWAARQSPALVIVDGVADLISSSGRSERDESDILAFFREYLRPFAGSGAACLISDHVAKDSDSAGLWPRGSGAKLGRYDGAVYLATLKEPYAPGIPGKIRLQIAKDRNGGVGPKHATAAWVEIDPSADNQGMDVCIVAPADNSRAEEFVEEKLHVAGEGGCLFDGEDRRLTLTKGELLGKMKGSNEKNSRILEDLVERGNLEVAQDGKKQLHRVARVFIPCADPVILGLVKQVESTYRFEG